MKRNFTRRDFLYTTSLGAMAIAMAEGGLLRSAWAEEKFTIASTGGSYGEGLREVFAEATGFAEKAGVEMAYSHQLESVATSKIVAQCGNAPFTVSAHGEAEAILLADAECLNAYDLDRIPNYQNIYPTSRLPGRAGLDAFWGSFMVVMFTLTYNTKEVSEPASFEDMFKAEYKGRIGVPAYGWYGMYWLHAFNKTLGGDEDNIDPGIEATARLVKDHGAVIIENVDHGMKAFTREEIVIAPFWNGRTFSLVENGVPVNLAYVPGSIQLGTGFIIAKGTPFVEAANDFVNLTLSGEFQIGMTKRFRYPPSDSTFKLPSEMEHYRVPPAALDNVVSLDWQKINDHRADYLERWNKEVLG